MSIKTSVGKAGLNKPEDVGLIQKKINLQYKANAAYKSALEKSIKVHSVAVALKVDNQCGPMTIEAIRQFQMVVMKWRHVDGRVDPNGATWRGLNGNVPNAKHIHKLIEPKTNGKYKVFSQWDYPNTKTGYSKSFSIRRIGCTLTTLTMAATAIGSSNEHWPANVLPKNLTPVLANDILKKSGAFTRATGGEMDVSKGAAALGMKYEEYGRYANLTNADLVKLTAHLNIGWPVAAHVDYRDKEEVADDLGDHWILLVRANCDGSISAVDPMFGGEINLKKTAHDNTRYQGDRANQKKGVLFGYNGNQHSSAGPKTQRNQQKYIVVRFGLLSPLVAHSFDAYDCPYEMPGIFLNRGFGGFSLVGF